MTPSASAPRLAAPWTPAASGLLRAMAGRAPWRAEMIGLGVALLMIGAFVALLLSAMTTASERRLDAEAAQRVLMACESKPLARERHACRLTLEGPVAVPDGGPQRLART